MRQYDLIVVGAGPAGSASAMTAARLGLKVALVDKARFPRNKLCGGGLTGRARKHLDAIFPAPPDCDLLSRNEITFGAFGQPLGTVADIPQLTLMMRRSFDTALMQQAVNAGAQDFTGCEVGGIDPARGEVSVNGQTLRASVLVGADGVNSSVARALFGRAFNPETIGFALEVELPPSDPPAPLRIDFGAAEYGYGWQFPKHSGLTIGIGGVKRRNPQIKRALGAYLAQLGVDNDVPVKGQFLPFGDARPIPGHGQTLLAGDAAGLVDPITGEGIAHALLSGHEAARATVKALDTGVPEQALAHYSRGLRPVHFAIRQANMIRPLMFAPRLRGPFFRAFKQSRQLKADYFRLLAGELEYGDITRGLVLRLPRHLLRHAGQIIAKRP